MEIWLKQGKAALRLPILPAEIQESEEMNNTTVNIDGLGEVTLLGKKKLATLQLSAHFPKHKAYYDNYAKYPSPKECVSIVEKMKDNGVARLIITDFGKGINRTITIEKFEYKEQDGTGDIYYTIETREYVKPGDKARSSKSTGTKRYKVKKGDTWAKIAKKFLGSSKKSVITKLKKINKMTKKKKPPIGKTIVVKK